MRSGYLHSQLASSIRLFPGATPPAYISRGGSAGPVRLLLIRLREEVPELEPVRNP